MAPFAIVGEPEATRGAKRLQLDTEMRKRPFSFDRHKTDQQYSALCHAAGLAYDPNLKSAPLNQCIKKARWLLGHRAVHLIIRISIERCSWCRYCSRPFLPLYLYGRLGMYRPLQNRYSHWLNGDPGSCRSGRSDAC